MATTQTEDKVPTEDLKRTHSTTDEKASVREHGTAIGAFDEKPPESGYTTTRRELWSFYVYYIVRPRFTPLS
jgi:hypothetical protein